MKPVLLLYECAQYLHAQLHSGKGMPCGTHNTAESACSTVCAPGVVVCCQCTSRKHQHPPHLHAPLSVRPQVGQRLELARLDDLLLTSSDGSEPVQIDVIKADIEGYEARALRGATRLLERHLPCAIIFELNTVVAAFNGLSPWAIFEDWLPRGYRVFKVGTSDEVKPPSSPGDAPLPWGEYEMRLYAADAAERCAHVKDPAGLITWHVEEGPCKNPS